jgi:uncharacterized protein (DUF305 family)
MVGQLITTSIAKFFSNAATGVNAALLINRSTRGQPKRSQGSARHTERPISVQLFVARGVAKPSQTGSQQGSAPIDAKFLNDARYSDKDFVARQIESHREAIALYEDKANGSDAQLRVFAQHILPYLQQHLNKLESLLSENRHARR